MTLTFPTMAERAVARFRDSTKTISVSVIATEMGAEKKYRGTTRVFTFDDDSVLEATGTGGSLRLETFLP